MAIIFMRTDGVWPSLESICVMAGRVATVGVKAVEVSKRLGLDDAS
jgi:hypothetical protein